MTPRLKEIREAKKLSQSELSKITGIPQNQLSRFESGTEMRESDIIKICKALKISADYFLMLKDK